MFTPQRIFLISKRCFSSQESYTFTELKNGIKKITMAHSKTRNALSIPMMTSLIENIKKDENDPNLRVIVIKSEGPVFSAGHNLKELANENGRHQQETVFKLGAHLMGAIIDSPVPIIAQIDGVAAAAGCQLVAQCDIAICTSKSTFLTPGANFGIFCSTPGIALARSVPKATALKMLLTGHSISALEAKNAGLVTEICDTDTALQETVNKYCAAIISKSRAVVELGKRFYYQQINLDIKKAYDLGGQIMVENLQLKDGAEGVRSFVEKRPARWSHE